MRTYVDEIERGEARFMLFPCTFTLLVIGIAVSLHGEWGDLSEALEQRGPAAGFFAFATLLIGGMALVKWLRHVRIYCDEEGVTLGPRRVYGTRRNFRWAEVSSWYEEVHEEANDEAPTLYRLVIERPGQPPIHFPEYWRGPIKEEVQRRLLEKQRDEAVRKVEGALDTFLPHGNEKATTIQP